MSMRRRDLALGAASFGMAQWLARSSIAVGAPPSPLNGQGHFILAQNWTFGTGPGATVRNMDDLTREFFFHYIYDQGKLDKLNNEWSRHAVYPEGDPRSLHVFKSDALVLKGRIPPGGGLYSGGIESGMLRAKFPVTPGMYIEMQAKLPRGLGVWPAFWLNPGVETSDGHFSEHPWPPEIDIFEFFVWQGRDAPRIMESNIQTNGDGHKFGDPHDLFTTFNNGKLDTGIDFSQGYHTFALDWVKDQPIWLLDGRKIKQTVYTWPAPPAHILVTNQIGMTLGGVDLSGMKADADNWDYSIKSLRVWRRA